MAADPRFPASDPTKVKVITVTHKDKPIKKDKQTAQKDKSGVSVEQDAPKDDDK